MKILPKSIFVEFRNKVTDPSYFPTHPLGALKARLTATWLLQGKNAYIVRQASDFILKTSTFKEQDISCLQQFAVRVKSFDELSICSTYTNITGTFLEYKLS